MIQAISASSPRATFRGSSGAYENSSKGLTNSKIALLNAGLIATTAGGVTTLVSKAYTRSWASAIALGFCGGFLSMFFMTPQIIEKTGLPKLSKNPETDVLIKEESQKAANAIKEHVKPRKFIFFKQS